MTPLGTLIALITSISFGIVSSLPANASTLTCPSGGTGATNSTSGVTLTYTSAGTPTCGPFGNGNPLNGNGSDPVNSLGYLTLDTTSSVGLLTLTETTGVTSGTFSFTTAGYQDFVLGFQGGTANTNPDYFSFYLPSDVTSGSWAINSTNGKTLSLGLLYGHTAAAGETPLPSALPLFATGLGALGLLGWRRKRKRAITIAAA